MRNNPEGVKLDPAVDDRSAVVVGSPRNTSATPSLGRGRVTPPPCSNFGSQLAIAFCQWPSILHAGSGATFSSTPCFYAVCTIKML